MGHRAKVGARWRMLALAASAVLTGCFGGSDDQGAGASGTVTFDFVPTIVAGANTRLDYAHTVQLPARFVVVEALDADTQDVYASTVTDAHGNYSVSLPYNVSVVIRAKAQMAKASGNPLAASVEDNTSGNAQWAITASAFTTSYSGMQTRNLDAGSGWNGTAYVDSMRAAGPFAILDTLYAATQKIAGVDAAATFPPLTVYWSPNNIAAGGGEDPAEIALGQIGITHFVAPDTRRERATGSTSSARPTTTPTSTTGTSSRMSSGTTSRRRFRATTASAATTKPATCSTCAWPSPRAGATVGPASP